MPTYDYKCLKCGHQFEVVQSMKDERLTDCPLEECDGAVKRMIGTGAGIIFKGSGFYETDYRSDSYKKAAKDEKSAGESGSSTETSKPAESKPAESKPAAEKSADTPKPVSAPAKADT